MSETQALNTSGYRIKFDREEFLRILSVGNPKRLYRLKKFVFFAFDGFVMFSEDLEEQDLMRYDVFDIIEFSNQSWQRT